MGKKLILLLLVSFLFSFQSIAQDDSQESNSPSENQSIEEEGDEEIQESLKPKEKRKKKAKTKKISKKKAPKKPRKKKKRSTRWRRVKSLIKNVETIDKQVEGVDGSLKDLDDRIYNIEKIIGEKSPLFPMDADRFRLGGFLTSTYAYLRNDSLSEQSFTSNRFELLLGVDVSQNLEFFTAFGIISQSVLEDANSSERTYQGDNADNRRQNPVPLIISHGTYKWSEQANIKFGRFVAPIGIINVEHFPPGLFLETAPQFLRPIPGGVFWGHFLNGVDLFGSFDVGGPTMDYHINYSSFSFINGPAPTRGNPSHMIYGGRLRFSFLDDEVAIGTSFQGGQRDPLGDGNRDDFNYENYGADLYVNAGAFNLKLEYVWSIEEGNDTNKKGLIVQPSLELSDQIRLVYRYDSYDKTDKTEDDAITEHIFGINYLPDPLLRLRVEYQLVDYESEQGLFDNGAVDSKDPDYSQLIVSAVISF